MISCAECPVRRLPLFRQFSPDELAFVSQLKVGEPTFRRREPIVVAGEDGRLLYSLLSGWAFRYIVIPGDGRQILDFLLPGDLIGLQSPLTGEIRHSVAALTDVTVCDLAGRPFSQAFEAQTGLGQAILRTVLLEQERSDRRLALLGRQRPTQRLCYLMLDLRDRLARRGVAVDGPIDFPLTYDVMSDALGLSRAQLARCLAEVRDRGWALLANQRLTLLQPQAMADFSAYRDVDLTPQALV